MFSGKLPPGSVRQPLPSQYVVTSQSRAYLGLPKLGPVIERRWSSVSLSIAEVAGIRELDPSLYGAPLRLGVVRLLPGHGSTMEGPPERAALLMAISHPDDARAAFRA